jgi:hypothetical protein
MGRQVILTGSLMRPGNTHRKVWHVIILGVILLILWFVLHISILLTIGIILIVIGVVLALLGAAGRGLGGRRHYF